MIRKVTISIKAALALFPLALLLGGCAGGLGDSVAQDRLNQAHAAYAAAKADPHIESNAADLLLEANLALQEADKSGNADKVTHLAYLAQRKVDTARNITEGKMAEMELQRVNKASADILMKKREREARLAKDEAAKAKQEAEARSTEAAEARKQAEAKSTEAAEARKMAESSSAQLEQAKTESEKARIASEQARQASEQARAETAQLTKELSDMKATETERGLVLTLGDVLFDTGKSDINPRAKNSLDRLADFLTNHPGRNLMIEGYTDSVGSDTTNQALSEKRAQAVKEALVTRGVGPDRVDIKGYGKANPVASNSTAHGRQLNRRVEVIILNQGAAGGRVSPERNLSPQRGMSPDQSTPQRGMSPDQSTTPQRKMSPDQNVSPQYP